jgi:hypothetical protein
MVIVGRYEKSVENRLLCEAAYDGLVHRDRTGENREVTEDLIAAKRASIAKDCGAIPRIRKSERMYLLRFMITS